MIEYRTLTKRDVDEWQRMHACDQVEGSKGQQPRIPRSGLQRGEAWISSIGCSQDLGPDTVRTVAAFDGDRMVGRLHVVYADLLIEGRRLQRCAVGEDFFVLEEYRDRAVGLSILLKALKLGLPFIEAGVSGQMRKILDSWKQFVLVDGSLMFQVALDRKGLVQIAKWDLYERGEPAGFWADKLTKGSLLLAAWRQRERLASRGRSELKARALDIGAMGLHRCLAARGAPVQLPWNEEILSAALKGADPNRGAWLVESRNAGHGPWLLTLYRQERVLGHKPGGSINSVTEAHLNEIFPPPDEADPIAELLAFAVSRAIEMGASVLQIHALTPAIERLCKTLELRSRMTKSIYIAANGVDSATRKLLSNPANWWCRAFNENQFEEVLHGQKFESRVAPTVK